MSAKWTWVFGIATAAALILGVLFFFVTTPPNGHDSWMLAIGAVIGGMLAAFIATFIWHRKPSPQPTRPLQVGQFTDSDRADKLKEKIDAWEQKLVAASTEEAYLETRELTAKATGTNYTDLRALKKHLIKKEQLKRQRRQLQENISEATAEREALKVKPQTLTATAPKGQIRGVKDRDGR